MDIVFFYFNMIRLIIYFPEFFGEENNHCLGTIDIYLELTDPRITGVWRDLMFTQIRRKFVMRHILHSLYRLSARILKKLNRTLLPLQFTYVFEIYECIRL